MYCWEAVKISQAAITELLLFRKSTGAILSDASPFLPHKGFALTVRLKTAKCECLWSSANCQVRMFLKQQNKRLQQLLAVKNKTILQQPKPSTFYIIFHITLACVHKCFTLTRYLKSAKNECLWSSVEHMAEALTCCRKKYLCSSKNHQFSTWYVLTQWKSFE